MIKKIYFKEENEVVPYDGGNTDLDIIQDIQDYGNLTGLGKEFAIAFVNNLKHYNVNEDEKIEMIATMIETLETIGQVPIAFFGIIEEVDGSQMPMVISNQLSEEEENMLINLFKPSLSISNSLLPIITRQSTALTPLEKELMIPPKQKPEFGDKNLNNIFNVTYNLTGDNNYAGKFTNKVKNTMMKLGGFAGRAVNKQIQHQKILKALPKGQGGLGLNENFIGNIANMIPKEKIRVEYRKSPDLKKLVGDI